MIRLLQLIAAPRGWRSRRSWAGVLAVRVLPKPLRIAVVDALDGYVLRLMEDPVGRESWIANVIFGRS